MNLLDLMIKVGVEDNATSGIDGIVGNVKNAATNIKNGLSTAIGVATKIGTAAAGAFTALSVAGLNATGELEQNTGGMLQVFKENAAEMESIAKTAYANMGLSASGFMGTANQIGALLQGSGFGIAESATLAADVMQRAADVASIMGIDISRAMESITGAAKGNFTMMDNLGVAINDNTIAQYALSKGITTSTREMSTQQKVGLAMELFMEKSAYAAGNYARENETLAGSLNTAKAALSNFLSGAGSASDVIDSVTNAAKVTVRNLKDIVPRLAEGIGEIAGGLAGELPGLFEAVIPAIASGAKALLDGIITTVRESAGTILQTVVDTLYEFTGIDLNPVVEPLKNVASLIKNTLGKMLDGVDLDGIGEKINGFLSGLGGAITWVLDAVQGDTFKGFLSDLQVFFGHIKSGLQMILEPVADGVKKLFAAFTGGDAGVVQSIADAFGAFAKWFEGNLAPAIATAATAIADLLEPFAEGVGTLITEIGDALGKVFQYATEGKASPLQRIADSFKKLVDAFKPYLSEVIDNVAKAIGNLFTELGKGIVEKFTAFADALERGEGFLGGIVVNVGEAITKISEFVLTLTDSEATTEEKLNKLGEVFGNVFYGIKETLTDAAEFIIEKFNAIKNFIENFDISAVAEGIKQKASEALENIKSGWNAFWSGAEEGYEERENKDIAGSTYATPTAQIPFNESGMGRSTSDLANTIISGATEKDIHVTINTTLDGRTVAENQWSHLGSISKQRGVPVGG